MVGVLAHQLVELLGALRRRRARVRGRSVWVGPYGATLVVAPRFLASTKTCSSCGLLCEEMTLAVRIFHCQHCGLVADRDTNAAANLAAWGEAEQCSATQARTPKHGAG